MANSSEPLAFDALGESRPTLARVKFKRRKADGSKPSGRMLVELPLPAPAVRPAEISVVVPTYNETANIPAVVQALNAALQGVAWEVIFVDDNSPDGTAERAKRLYEGDPRVRCLRRIGRRGLSTACIEGMLASSAPIVAVMDADLQHDPTLLPRMLRLLKGDETDIVVGSRYVEGGGLGGWGADRARLSRFATELTQKITPVPLSDPMSGFFALRRDMLDRLAPNLSGLGFKILLDLVLSGPKDLRVKELPYTFGLRQAGESKLSMRVTWEFLLLLIDKTIGRVLPARFFAFACVGLLGVAVHFAVLAGLMMVGVDFAVGQALATLTAMIANYAVNNELTYADRTNRGWRWLTGLGSFVAVCGFGALANVGVASFLVHQKADWPLAALAGIAASAVWNYAVSDRYTWKRAA